MPEGDTVHKVAAAMAPRLIGQELRELRLRRARGVPLESRRVARVYAHGKHLLVEMDDGRALRVHLGMYGAWHRYRAAEPWHKPARRAAVVLCTDRDQFVCFDAKDVEVLAPSGVRPANLFNRLGPDLLAPQLATAEIVRRAREFNPDDTPLVDVLLDQRVACGIGNVYKSELLFMTRRHPLETLRALDDGALEGLYQLARRLLTRNLGGGRRVTRDARDGRGRLWVYGRRARPCLECGTPISHDRLGRDWRPSYWCGSCQTR